MCRRNYTATIFAEQPSLLCQSLKGRNNVSRRLVRVQDKKSLCKCAGQAWTSIDSLGGENKRIIEYVQFVVQLYQGTGVPVCALSS